MKDFCYRKKKAHKAQARRSSHGTSGSSSGGFEKSSAGLETQELLMLLHRLAASTPSGVVDSVTQSSAITGSAIVYQSSTLWPPSTPSGTYPWYLDFSASFHITRHSAHLSSLHHSYHHCIVHTVNGSPLSVAGQGTLSFWLFLCPRCFSCSWSDHAAYDRLLTMTIVLFLILMFAIFRIVALVTWLALASVGVIHSIFESLTGFVFLPLRLPVLSALPMLLRPHHRLLSDIIV
jgi:hypothetical protein